MSNEHKGELKSHKPPVVKNFTEKFRQTCKEQINTPPNIIFKNCRNEDKWVLIRIVPTMSQAW